MARGNRERDGVETSVTTLVEDILTSGLLSKDSISAIENRADIVSKIVKGGSKGNWNPDDPKLISGLVALAVEEFIFSTMDSGAHRSFGEDLSDAVLDNKSSHRSSKDTKRPTRYGQDLEDYFSALYAYLKTNSFPLRPTFATFIKFSDKFSSKKIVPEPAVESSMDLYNKWENWVSRTK